MNPIDTLIKATIKRIDAQVYAKNYSGYNDTIEKAVYEAYQMGVNDLGKAVQEQKNRIIERTK